MRPWHRRASRDHLPANALCAPRPRLAPPHRPSGCGRCTQCYPSVNAVGDQRRNCYDHRSPGCTIIFESSRVDLSTGSVIFESTCDPLGMNPHDGEQIFAVRPDGSGLRQLTQTQGIIKNSDRSIDVELPGPFHIPTRLR